MYLRRCLDSLLLQTYKNFEILLILDGSTDSSSRIAEEYRNNNPCIRIIYQDNLGVATTRNTGVENAIGEYIAFVDSDDYVSPKYLELLYRAMQNENADIAVCGFYWVDNSDNVHLFENENRRNAFFDRTMDSRAFMIQAYKHYSYYTILWNKLYRKKIFFDIRFPDGHIYEDSYLLRDIIYNADKIVSISERLYFYVQHNGSITAKNDEISITEDVSAIMYHIDYYRRYKDKELSAVACAFLGDRIVHYLSQFRKQLSKPCLKRLKHTLFVVMKQLSFSKTITLKRKIKYLLFLFT